MRRPIGCWLVLLPLLLVAGACAPTAVVVNAPVLDREGVARLLVAAEMARADAFANADPRPLRAVFADPATGSFLPELARLRQRGERIEERATSRRLVHWSAAAGTGEGVLEVAGEQRVGLVGALPRAWTRIVHQWWAAFLWTRGRWLVLRSGDLAPDQWWKA